MLGIGRIGRIGRIARIARIGRIGRIGRITRSARGTRPMRSSPQITIDVALLSADFSSFINSLGEVSLIITLYTQHCAGR